MPECIYCREEKADSAFNREHVVPESFGKFRSNLTLLKCVCTDCNSLFGRELDRLLARGSMEGLLRYSYGVKPLSDAEDFVQESITVSLSTADEWNGFKAQLRPVPNDFEVVPVPQVGIRRLSTGTWQYIVEEELDSELQAAGDDIDHSQMWIALYPLMSSVASVYRATPGGRL